MWLNSIRTQQTSWNRSFNLIIAMDPYRYNLHDFTRRDYSSQTVRKVCWRGFDSLENGVSPAWEKHHVIYVNKMNQTCVKLFHNFSVALAILWYFLSIWVWIFNLPWINRGLSRKFCVCDLFNRTYVLSHHSLLPLLYT